MPSITPQLRATIGGTDEFAPHRSTVKAATGMNLPKLPEATPTEAQKTGQTGTTEDTAPQAVTLSPQLTALARKQQKLQAEVQAQRDKEAQWEKEKAGYVPRDTFKTKLQQNAAEALRELGTDYEELTNLLLSQQQGDDPVRALKSEVDQLKKSQEENVNKQYEATLRQYRSETESLITSDAKSFHFIVKGQHQDAVVQHIVDTWKEDDTKVLTVEQAAKDIEEFLREDAKEKAAHLKELEPATEETPVEEKKKLPPPKAAAPRTLTQQVEATPTRTYNQFQHLSMKERVAQAMARAQKI